MPEEFTLQDLGWEAKLPEDVLKWSAQANPIDIPTGVRQHLSDVKAPVLDAAEAYQRAVDELASHVLKWRDSMLEAASAVSFTPLDPETSAGSRSPGPQVKDNPWELLGNALTSGDTTGVLYIGGEPSDEQIYEIERLIAEIVATANREIVWGEPRVSSWWRPFKTSVAKRVTEQDLDTVKRAAEVQLLDRYEGESAKSYSEAIAALGEAFANERHVYVAAKNIIFLKTVLPNGESFVGSRVLTPTQVLAFQAGELAAVMSDPDTALRFVRTGALPVADLPAIEGDSSE